MSVATLFAPFLEHYPPDHGPRGETPPQLAEWAAGRVTGWSELMETYAGCTFHNGLYRLHTEASAIAAGEQIDRRRTYGRVHLDNDYLSFGFDWIGRQFVIEKNRSPEDEPEVLLVDPLTDETYETNSAFLRFHIHVLVEQSDGTLDSAMFESWTDHHREALPLRSDQIVGYRIPLSLGGKHELSNLVLVDAELELELNRQIDEQIRDLPEGTPIKSVGSDH
jgi:hypothetical protein